MKHPVLYLHVSGMVFILIFNKCIRKSVGKSFVCKKGSVQYKLGKEKQLNEAPGPVGFERGHNVSVIYSRREIYFIPSKNE